MKKIILIAVLGHLVSGNIRAQVDSANIPSPSIKLDKFVIKFSTDVNPESFTLPFSYIEMVDVRHDTSKLGFHRPKFSNKAEVFTTDSGLHVGMGSYLNRYYSNNLDKNSSKHLLVCLKKFWLSDFDRSEIENADENNDRSFLYIKTELYLQSGEQYFPVQRLDTIFITKRLAKYSAVDFMQEAMKYAVEKMRAVDFTAITKKRSVDRRRLDSFNVANISTVFETDQLIRGVYLSFEEFRNNRPSYKEFDIKFEKLTDILYVKESDGKFYVKRNVWGFYNGKNLFIRMGLNYFPLFRHQQTLEFFGSNNLQKRTISVPHFMGNTFVPMRYAAALAAVNSSTKVNSKIARIRPFQIDMETGQFY